MPIHISRGDESSGPYSLEEVQAYLDQGLLLPTDLAWQEGLEDWMPLSELLGQSTAPEPAPSPPAPVMAELVSVEQVAAEPASKPRSRKGLLIGIGAGVAVLAIAGGVWFGFFRSDGSNQKEQQVAQGGEPKDKGTDKDVPAKTNAPVVPVIPQTVETNAPVDPVKPKENKSPKVDRIRAKTTSGIEAAKKADDEGRYADAVKLYLAELATEEAKPEPSWVQLSYLNNSLGFVLDGNGQYDKALVHHEKSLAILLKQLGADHPEVATSYNNIGMVRHNKGEYDKALEYHQKALAIWLKQLPADHPLVATSYNNIGLVRDKKGEYDKALENFQKSLAIELRRQRPDPGPVYNNIGGVHYSKGEYDKALEYFQKTLAIRLRQLRPDHPDVAQSYNNIGAAHERKAEYDKALEHYQKALAIRHKLDPSHPSVAESYNNIAAVHYSMAEYDKALEYFQKALVIFTNKLDPSHPNVALSYGNIGAAHEKKAEYDKALEHYRKSLAIELAKLRPDHPSVVTTYNNFGWVHRNKGEYNKALEYFQKALSILANDGRDHPELAHIYNNIGGVHIFKGDYDKALEYFQKALVIELRRRGPDHPDVAMNYIDIGFSKIALNDPKAALDSARKAQTIIDKRLVYTLSFTSERTRLAYQQAQLPYILLGTLGAGPDLAEAVLRNKGVVLASLMEDQRIAKASKDPAIKALAVQLRSAQQRLNKLQLEIPEPKARSAHETKRKAAMAKVEQLQQEMARNVKGLGKARRALAIKPKDVQKNLAKDQILLEFIRYNHFLERAQWQYRYGVVVLAKEGEAKWVPLGSAEEIDKLCLNYGSYLKDDRITDEQYVPLLRLLHDRLMAPVAKVAPKTAKTWIISPTSQINFVNFATFLTPKDRFVCEDYTIKYVASGRDLVPPKGKKPKTNPQLVVFANPKYENKPPTLAVVTRDLGETTLRGAERNDLRASILGLSPLPGTQKEADYLEDKAPDWKLEPRIFVEDEAVERQLYLVDSPKVLHLATHGMFLKKPPEPKKAPTGALGRINQRKDFIGRLQNPMQRSALMFTGATWTSKEWAKGATPDTANDGILTAAEVGTLNLKGTQLVVMSACQTGLGDLRSGEGVMGLRRGFIQAGTQNLLMTLWPVSDKYTVQFMKEFYERAMVDGDAPESLAAVQKKLLVRYREVYGTKMAVNLAGPFILNFQGADKKPLIADKGLEQADKKPLIADKGLEQEIRWELDSYPHKVRDIFKRTDDHKAYAIALTKNHLEKVTSLVFEDPDLKAFGGGDEKISDADLKDVTKLKQLRVLGLGYNQITDAGLKEVAKLQYLTELSLDGARITNKGLKELAELKMLHTLYLHNWKQITKAGLKELAKLTQLTNLGLNFTDITDADLKELELANFKNFATLALYRTQISDAGLKEVAKFKQLRLIYLRHTKVTKAGVAQLKKALPKCTIIY